MTGQNLAYFISWTPRKSKESYDHETETVEYDIYFASLQIDGHPVTIRQW